MFIIVVKNLSDNYFKYLSEEFNPEQLNLVQQKGVNPYDCMDCFERFSKDELADKKHFYRSLKLNISAKKIIYMLPKFEITLK